MNINVKDFRIKFSESNCTFYKGTEKIPIYDIDAIYLKALLDEVLLCTRGVSDNSMLSAINNAYQTIVHELHLRGLY